MMEQPIKVTEWQQTYTYDSGIHSGVNTQVPSVSSKCLGDDDEVYGKQYTIKKTTTSYCQGGGQSQSQAQGRGLVGGDAKGVSHQLGCVSASFFHLPHGSPVACAYRAPSGHSSTQPSTPWELLLPKISSLPPVLLPLRRELWRRGRAARARTGAELCALIPACRSVGCGEEHLIPAHGSAVCSATCLLGKPVSLCLAKPWVHAVKP